MKYRIFQKLISDRVFKTILLAFIFMTPMGFMQSPVIEGIYPEEFWARKANWYHCADIVLAGDSRVIDGLCPSEMQKYLKDYKILNYGLGWACFSKKYLEKVESVLNPESNKRIIVTGISPLSLTKRESEPQNFIEVTSMSKSDQFFRIHFSKIMHFYEPLKLKHAIRNLRMTREEIENRIGFYPDGWIAGNKYSIPSNEVLKKYVSYYDKRNVDPCNIDNVMTFVEKWVKQGISVYGFFPPSSKEMYELEMERSGINEQEVINKFKQAGGTWIDVEPDGYVSYDCTHLQRDSALVFSKDIAETILENENKN